jgi:hypothetical protein
MVASLLLACSDGLPVAANDAGPTDATIVDAQPEADVAELKAATCDRTTCGSGCVDTTTDGQNCGACGHSCLGGACTAGVCKPVKLASNGTSGAQVLAIDSTYVYFSAPKEIARVAKSGGAVEQVVPTTSAATSMAINGGVIYWVGQSSLYSAPVAGASAPTFLYASISPLSIAVDANNVYWGEHGGSVHQAPKNGAGPVLTLASNLVAPSCVLVDATSVYWVNDDVPIAGVFRATIGVANSGALLPGVDTNGLFDPHSLVLDDSGRLWFTSTVAGAEDGGTLHIAPIDGGPETIVGPVLWDENAARNSGAIYYSTNSTGQVLTTPFDGGPQQVLASGYNLTVGIAADDTAVYYTDAFVGDVWKLAL